MRRAGIIVAAAIAVGAVYLVRLDRTAGLYVDDAWYVVLATAILHGEGPRLISSATTAILPAFPPGFPMLLAPVLAVTPPFPDNVTALKAVSIAAMLLVAIASYVYLTRYRSAPPIVAGAVAVITVLMPAFVFLATSMIMAEPLFTLSQLCLAIAIERCAGRVDRAGHPEAIVAGVVGGLTLLVRLAGIAGVLAGVVYLMTRRGWRTAAIFAAVTAACYAPWLAYSAANRVTDQERYTHGGSVASGYGELLLMRYGGEPGSGRITVGEVPGRIAYNIINIFGRDIGAQLFPTAYRTASESGLEALLLSGETGLRSTGMGGGAAIIWISSSLSLVVLIGFVAAIRRGTTVAEWIVLVTVAMVVLVPARSFRYVLPLAPFIVYYFFSGIDAIAVTMSRRPAQGPFRIAAACILVLFVADHTQYVLAARRGEVAMLRDADEVENVIQWMRVNLTDSSPVASSNPGLVWLATGRKTLALSNPRTHWREWQDIGVRYAVALHVADKPPRSLGYRTIYESPRLKLWVIELPLSLTESDKHR